ncbi:MAG: hypothetical protein SNJ55_11365 [Chloroherpetonaceae bacterium]
MMTRLQARKEALEIVVFVIRRMAFDNPANASLPDEIELIAEEMMRIADTLDQEMREKTEEETFLELCENVAQL